MQPLKLTAKEALSPRITRFRFEHPEGAQLPEGMIPQGAPQPR